MVRSASSESVVLFTLGGTISMTRRTTDGDGVVPRLGGADLVGGLPGLGVGVDVRDLRAVPSADLACTDLLDVVDAANTAATQGARGAVLTQGTDTMEEAAFFIDAVWSHDVPFVVTGAMRNPTQPSGDGPANVFAAIRVAASPAARGRGALVVFNDQIHAARHVRKSHSASTATFTSPDLGPVGQLVEGEPRFLAHVPRVPTVTGISRARLDTTRVALYTVTLDDDGLLITGVSDTHQGLVVAGFGVGHVPGSLAPELGDLAATMPVVLTTRTGAGSVFAGTYGAVGSERDLLARGLIDGGFLHPYKARVLLRLLIAGGADHEEIAGAFAQYR